MTTIGFIGLGVMGAPMARNLVNAGFQVNGFARREAPLATLERDGGRACPSISQAVQDADVVITMVSDSPDVEAVVLGPDGVFAHARPGALVIDMSTIRPDVARNLGGLANEHGLRMIDAPVSGGEQGAKDAALSIMVGGADEDFATAAPILESLGRTVVHVGPSGSGQTVKAANQLIVAGTLQLVSESIVFLSSHGVELEAAVRVLAGGLAGNAILDRKSRAMLAGDFTPGFRVDLHHKDLGIVMSSAREAGVVLPVGAVVSQLMASLRANGHGSLDHSALLLLAQQMSGQSEQPTRAESP